MHVCQRDSAWPRAAWKEGTPESLPHLLLAWPCHLFSPQTFVNDVRIPTQVPPVCSGYRL